MSIGAHCIKESNCYVTTKGIAKHGLNYKLVINALSARRYFWGCGFTDLEDWLSTKDNRASGTGILAIFLTVG